jgi:hypothetical protein
MYTQTYDNAVIRRFKERRIATELFPNETERLVASLERSGVYADRSGEK